MNPEPPDSGLGEMTPSETDEHRQAREADIRRRLEEIPVGTVFACGWETKRGTVQGSRYMRTTAGLVPVRLGRDERPADLMRREVQASRMPWTSQSWGIQILATPVEQP